MISFIDTTSAQGGKDESKDQEYIEVIEELEQQNARIIALMAQSQKVGGEIQLTNQYIKRTLLNDGRKDESHGDQF